MTVLPETKQLEGGRLWKLRDGFTAYESEDSNFDILIGNGYVVLVSFIHDPIDDAEFWRKRFATIEAAMDYAEKM